MLLANWIISYQQLLIQNMTWYLVTCKHCRWQVQRGRETPLSRGVYMTVNNTPVSLYWVKQTFLLLLFLCKSGFRLMGMYSFNIINYYSVCFVKLTYLVTRNFILILILLGAGLSVARTSSSRPSRWPSEGVSSSGQRRGRGPAAVRRPHTPGVRLGEAGQGRGLCSPAPPRRRRLTAAGLNSDAPTGCLQVSAEHTSTRTYDLLAFWPLTRPADDATSHDGDRFGRSPLGRRRQHRGKWTARRQQAGILGGKEERCWDVRERERDTGMWGREILRREGQR